MIKHTCCTVEPVTFATIKISDLETKNYCGPPLISRFYLRGSSMYHYVHNVNTNAL